MDSAQFVLPLHSCSLALPCLALALWRQGAKRCAPAASALARSCVPGPFAGPWQRARGTVTWPALCSFAAHRPRARCPEPQARCKDHARPLGCVFSPQEGVACLWKKGGSPCPASLKATPAPSNLRETKQQAKEQTCRPLVQAAVQADLRPCRLWHGFCACPRPTSASTVQTVCRTPPCCY